MTKRLSLVASLGLLFASACTKAPEPVPDAAQLEIVLSTIQRQEDARAARFQEKIAGADRISGTLAKVEPQKLDPKIASVFLR